MQGSRVHACLLLILAAVLTLVGCAGGAADGRDASDASLMLHAFSLRLPSGASEDVTLPASLDAKLPHDNVEYTLSTVVVLPPALRGQPLTLSLGDLGAIASARANGVSLTPLRPGVLDSYRATEPVVFVLPANLTKDGTLAVEVTVLHRWYKSAVFADAPVLSTRPLGPEDVVLISTWNQTTALFALAASAVVVLLYSFVWLAMRGARSRPYGFFAIGGATGMFYPAFLLGLTQPIFGAYDVAVMGLMLVTGSVAALYFSRAYFDWPAPNRAWLAVPPLALVVCFVGHSAFYAVRVIGVLVALVGTAHAASQTWLLARLPRERRVSLHQWPIALAWPITALVGIPDFAPWFGLGAPFHGVRTACLGIMTIAIYQAVSLSREHLMALRHAGELVVELNRKVETLEASNREVAMLNDELRRQIALRSKELVVRLADMDAGVVVAPKLSPGDVFEGRYVVHKALGEGGMGAVYEVSRQADGRKFALKVFSGGDSFARARFAREAQICAEVKHPNVVTIVDVDVAQQGFPFMVMELVTDGATLYDVRRRKQDTPWTLGVLLQVCEGMAAIHGAGIIHRDLKPSNILLSRGRDGTRPTVKITDFGISALAGETRLSDMIMRASAPSGLSFDLPDSDDGQVTLPAPSSARRADGAGDVDAEGDAITAAIEGSHAAGRAPVSRPGSAPRSADFTATGVIFGTPQYMAGELTEGTKSATTSSDMFAIGLIAFELLVGKRPFAESPLEARLKNHDMPTPPPIAQYCADLPFEVASLLDRALSHDPAVRPEAKTLAAAIRAALRPTQAAS